MPATRNTCNCPETTYGMLPMKISNEAQKGNSEKVLEWLKEGGDINATDMNFKTLVHIASEKNFVHLLKELLKFPDVHLNQGTTLSSNSTGKGATPLSIAMERNHMDCVDALLNSPSKCKINLVEKTPSTQHALRMAVNRGNWKMTEKLLNAGAVLNREEATFVFDSAAKTLHEDVVKMIIDKEFPLTYATTHNAVFKILYANNMWDYVGAERAFQKCLQHENYWGLFVLEVMLEKRDFSTMENVLKMLTPSVEINTNIANAILGKELVPIEKSLAEEDLKEGVIEGAIFVAAIAGSTEEIAEKLFSLKEDYPKDFFKYVLLVAALFNRAELYPLLLKNNSFNFSTLCSASQISASIRGRGTMLIERALKKIAKKIIEDDDDDDDDEDKE